MFPFSRHGVKQLDTGLVLITAVHVAHERLVNQMYNLITFHCKQKKSICGNEGSSMLEAANYKSNLAGLLGDSVRMVSRNVLSFYYFVPHQHFSNIFFTFLCLLCVRLVSFLLPPLLYHVVMALPLLLSVTLVH